MCLFQHWLTNNPIIAFLNTQLHYISPLVLQAEDRYHCVVCWNKQLFRKIDGYNTIAACHQPFLTSAVKINYVLNIKKQRGRADTNSVLTLSSSDFLGMTGDADSSGPALWPLTSLTTCRYISHVSVLTLHFLQFVCTPACIHIISIHLFVAYPEPSMGLLLALYRQHQRISIGQGEPEFMVLPLAVFGCIDHSALGQQQVHVGACVLRTLIALQKRGHRRCTVNWRRGGELQRMNAWLTASHL